MTIISFSKKRFHWKKQLKENDTALKGVRSENEELRKQIAVLLEQLSKSNDNQ